MELVSKDRKTRKKPPIDLDNMVYCKVPPQAKDIEQAVLGTILLNMQTDAFDIASETLYNPECFYVDAHKRIFSACQRLSNRGVRCEIISVAEELKKTEELDIVGGPYALTVLTNYTTANLEDNCKIILEKFISRELIRISGETIGIAYEDSTDCFDALDDHETKLVILTTGFIKGGFQTMGNLSAKAITRIDYLRSHRDQLSGVPTGFKTLDRLTNGWQPTDLIILAARPSVGKTAFALNLARNAATNSIKPTAVGFFSLEMGAAQLTDRLLSAESGILLEKIKRGRMEDYEHRKLLLSSGKVGDMQIFIDDTASLNIFELRSKARRLVNKHGVGLIIIDYLQLMSGSGDRNTNREQDIANISRNLKALAKQLNIPIIALSQMSRAIETRKENKEPMLSDLRESGAIEQDADMVMFLYRPDYQLSADEIDPSIKGQAIGKIAKHRNGDLEKIPFRTDLSIQMWYDEAYENSKPTYAPPSNFRRIESKEAFDEGMSEAAPF
jgi:replicative DNA helicase